MGGGVIIIRAAMKKAWNWLKSKLGMK